MAGWQARVRMGQPLLSQIFLDCALQHSPCGLGVKPHIGHGKFFAKTTHWIWTLGAIQRMPPSQNIMTIVDVLFIVFGYCYGLFVDSVLPAKFSKRKLRLGG